MKILRWAALGQVAAGMALGGWMAAAAVPVFKAETNGFSFDTGVLRGQVQANRKAFGVVPVKEAGGGVMARSMGWLGVYRVFSDGQRYGDGGWDWPNQASVLKDGSLLVHCPAQTNRPFALNGRYRWRNERTLDLELTVLPEVPLKNFEVFIANYFSPDFTNAAVLARVGNRGPREWLRADRALADWLMFPRDAWAAPVIQDGRWQLPPNPVEWKLQHEFSLPVALRRAPGQDWSVVMLGDPRECFAIAMPYETEGHYSAYLSHFGRDLPARKAARAQVRLQWLKEGTPAEAERAWARFK